MSTPMENQGKSPSILLEDFTKKWWDEIADLGDEHGSFKAWLRHSMSDLLRWSAEQMPQKKGAVCHECDGYDTAIDDCKATLLRLADEICKK